MTSDLIERLREAGEMAASIACRSVDPQPGLDANLVNEAADELTTANETIARLERELSASNARAEALLDDGCNKIMAMSDEQIYALTRLEGRNPDDVEKLSRKALEIAALKTKLATKEAELLTLRALRDMLILDGHVEHSKDDLPGYLRALIDALIECRAELLACRADAALYRYIKQNAPPEGVTLKFFADGNSSITWGVISEEDWKPIETAPKDGTLLWLLLADDDALDNAIEGEADHLPRTIGHNNFDHDGVDEWLFSGWNWENDYYTEGRGTPTHWMLPPPAIDAAIKAGAQS